MGIDLSSESEVGPYTHGSSTARGNSNTESMIRIPGGTFRMGSDKHYPEEAPVHRVTRSRSIRQPVMWDSDASFAKGSRDETICNSFVPELCTEVGGADRTLESAAGHAGRRARQRGS
jgi:hypothetical protein